MIKSHFYEQYLVYSNTGKAKLLIIIVNNGILLLTLAENHYKESECTHFVCFNIMSKLITKVKRVMPPDVLQTS